MAADRRRAAPLTLAFHHDSHIDLAANEEGNVLVHPATDPLLVLLVNDDFALLFWGVTAAVAFRFDRGLAPGEADEGGSGNMAPR